MLLPLVAADVGITTANPRFSYTAMTTDLEFLRTPALGAMVVSLENVTKEDQQALLPDLGSP